MLFRSQGIGNLSAFDQGATLRKRNAVVIADPDSAGEALALEFPAHDAPDRGSPLKIGGRANNAVPALVVGSDRTNAWFTLNGQLGVVETCEPAVVYDGGRRSIFATFNTWTHSNNSLVLVAAVGGMKHKVLTCCVTCYALDRKSVV